MYVHIIVILSDDSYVVLLYGKFRDGCLNDLGRSASEEIEDQWINKNQKNLEFKVICKICIIRITTVSIIINPHSGFRIQ